MLPVKKQKIQMLQMFYEEGNAFDMFDRLTHSAVWSEIQNVCLYETPQRTFNGVSDVMEARTEQTLSVILYSILLFTLPFDMFTLRVCHNEIHPKQVMTCHILADQRIEKGHVDRSSALQWFACTDFYIYNHLTCHVSKQSWFPMYLKLELLLEVESMLLLLLTAIRLAFKD